MNDDQKLSGFILGVTGGILSLVFIHFTFNPGLLLIRCLGGLSVIGAGTVGLFLPKRIREKGEYMTILVSFAVPLAVFMLLYAWLSYLLSNLW